MASSSLPPRGHVRLATASPATHPAGLTHTLSDLAGLARRAAAQNADLLLLPEAYLGGYPRGCGFGTIVGERTAEGREEFRRYFKGAVDLGDIVGEGGAGGGEKWVRRELVASTLGSEGGDEAGRRGDGTREELERVSRETGVFLVVGLIERAGGSLYCAAVYVDPARGIIGKRRKVMPTASERLIWAQGAPSTLRAVSTTIRGIRINMAAAICWESYMPLLRQTLYAQNVNLYLAPSADGRDAWLSLMRTVGCEGRCFVVSSNMADRGDAVSAPPAAGRRLDEAEHQQEEWAERVGTARRVRRSSCFTEEGNEIALPGPPRDGHAHEHGGSAVSATASVAPSSPPGTKSSSPKRRRKSVIVEDGHEIVLCCDEEEGQGNTGVQKEVNGVDGWAVRDVSPGTRPTAASATKTTGGAWKSRGGSCIVGPLGDVLAGPQWEDDEGLIWTDVDFEDCVRGRLDLDAGGSYSRNDSFKFSVEGLDLEPLPYY